MFRRLYYWLCDPAGDRWYWPIVRIFGGPGRDTVYMTRTVLTPKLPPSPFIGFKGGQLYLNVLHREDMDRDPHDHPFDFWTLPLNMGYIEHVYSATRECWAAVRVPPWRWSARKAEHIHRVVSTDSGRWPLVTLVWRGPTRRKWGFWVHAWDALESTKRRWVKMMDYLYSGDGATANIPGQDVACPGRRNTWRRD